jgi:RHS repeat-associated protein
MGSGNLSPLNNTILYTGREYDREINLYYMRARYYDA